ncbi:hypothetical protein EHQ52_10140 [Leptospira koniambonensis]|uniref:Uncharacterized protein n=1 Tax=Leptospira koniambonensis TaxID=2484950 RepID=A0A4R9J895_9LEPT|nr:hypothetical protein [Leptospira koniambonensis]TGL34840.1 hypothetical protein EHQ52_10140 [Leptospira koniambonensis]
MQPVKILLGAFAYFISSFLIQGILAAVIASDYFNNIPVFRTEPIFYLSMGSTLLSGFGFAALFPITNFAGSWILKGLKYGLLTALIIVPFVAFDLPGRFAIPSTEKWILIQGLLGTIHSCVAGVLTSLVYRNR